MPVVAPWIGLHSLGWPIALGLVLLGVLALPVYVGRCLPLLLGPRHGKGIGAPPPLPSCPAPAAH